MLSHIQHLMPISQAIAIRIGKQIKYSSIQGIHQLQNRGIFTRIWKQRKEGNLNCIKALWAIQELTGKRLIHLTARNTTMRPSNSRLSPGTTSTIWGRAPNCRWETTVSKPLIQMTAFRKAFLWLSPPMIVRNLDQTTLTTWRFRFQRTASHTQSSTPLELHMTNTSMCSKTDKPTSQPNPLLPLLLSHSWRIGHPSIKSSSLTREDPTTSSVKESPDTLPRTRPTSAHQTPTTKAPATCASTATLGKEKVSPPNQCTWVDIRTVWRLPWTSSTTKPSSALQLKQLICRTLTRGSRKQVSMLRRRHQLIKTTAKPCCKRKPFNG